jgi:hypothetical protein
MPREHYDDLFLDYVYGLLDPAEVESLRAHVETCSPCRLALTEAEGQQRELARAARVVERVPFFTIPGQAPQTAIIPGSATPAAATPTFTADAPPATGIKPAVSPTSAVVSTPLSTPAPRPRRSPWRRYLLVSAAAAAVLVAAAALHQAYQSELSVYEVEVARLRKDVETVDARFAALQAKVPKETQERARLLKEQLPPQLEVVGPAYVHPDNPPKLQVVARGLDGQPRDAEVTMTPLATAKDPAAKDAAAKEPAQPKDLTQQVDKITGAGIVQLQEAPGEEALSVRVEAKAVRGKAVIAETIQLAEPTYASHLTLNKSLYYVGDLLFFRALTLDRYSLKPPAQPLALRFTLSDANGRVWRELPAHTASGGISGGEFALTGDLVNGSYTLQVNAADGASTKIVPQARTLEILRADTPQIAFDRNVYKPGETFGVTVRGGGQPGNSAFANKQVDVSLQVDGKAAPQGPNQAPGPYQTRFDNDGNLPKMEFRLPPEIKNTAEIVIDPKDGKGDNKLIQAVPVVPSERTIDLFPEGGDLVAGALNRVYYRVRAPQGEPIPLEGHVIVLAGTKVLHDSKSRHGAGSFDFTPDPNETYAVRVTGPSGATTIADPFGKLGIQRQGIVLHAPDTVVREGTPLALVIRGQGAPRRVLLQTNCRGQIVDQRYLDVRPGDNPVKVQPAPGAAGVLRVTALDVSPAGFVPLAERLLYVIPEKRLDVLCQNSAGPGPYAAGGSTTLNFHWADEHKNTGPAWLMATVVDEKYRADRSEPSLAAHFYLAGDLGGDDLDSANFMLSDAPESRQALDVFLGTHGWRRFVRGENPPLVATPPAATPKRNIAVASQTVAKSDAKPAAASVAAGFFNRRANAPSELQKTYQAELEKEVSALIDQANRERNSLVDDKDTALQVFSQAVRDLAEFRQLPGVYFRLGLGILTVLLLVVGAGFLTVGLFRLVRKKEESPTACFAGAFSCLFACLLLYFVAGRMPAEGLANTAPPANMQPSAWPVFSAENLKVAAGTEAKKTDAALALAPVGYFAPLTLAPADPARQTTGVAAPKSGVAAELTKHADNPATRAQTFNANQSQLRTQGNLQRQVNEAAGEPLMKRRFEEAAAKAKSLAPAPPLAAGAKMESPSRPGGYGGSRDGADKKVETEFNMGIYAREYAYRGTGQRSYADFPDTLLWQPAVFSVNGQAQVSFDLPQNAGVYRVLVFANSPDGRLGFYEGTLEVQPNAK